MTECVLLLQNVFSYYRMCSLTTECVLGINTRQGHKKMYERRSKREDVREKKQERRCKREEDRVTRRSKREEVREKNNLDCHLPLPIVTNLNPKP